MQKPLTAAIYARVSTDDQNCGMQLTELRQYAERMNWQLVEYTEKASSVRKRVVLDKLMADARMKKFDVVLCWKLDRFGRSLQQLITNIQALDTFGVRFVCPTQGIDTDKQNPASRLMMHIFGAVAEFERALIVERVKAGLAQYKHDFAAGKVGRERASRSGKNMAPHRPQRIFRRDEALELREIGLSYGAIAKRLSIPKQTVVDAIKRAAAAA